ncbi:MAG: methyltransferase domain-containing protein [bacterium]
MKKIKYSTHNWLAHKINNRAFRDNRACIKGRVVDLGCGTAQYKEDILEIADEYIGVDWENSAHSSSNVDVFANLSGPLPFKDDFADTIVSFQVMEHLPEPGVFLSESRRILRTGGRLFLTVPFMWHVHEAPHDYFRYTRYGLEYLLEKAGFADIQITELTGVWQTIALKFNYSTVRHARGPLKIVFIPLWWLGQAIAPVLDRYDRNPHETGGYTVTAKKEC